MESGVRPVAVFFFFFWFLGGVFVVIICSFLLFLSFSLSFLLFYLNSRHKMG